MHPSVIYLIQSSVILAFLYFVYALALSKTTFYSANRYYLLLALTLSAVIPFLPIPAIESSRNMVGAMIGINNPTVQTTIQVAAQGDLPSAERSIDLPYLLLVAYAVVSLALILRLLIQVRKLTKLNKKGKTFVKDGIKYIQITGLKAPFTFNNNIYFDPEAQDSTTLEYILNHETTHAVQSHTTDLLIASVYGCVFWINPFSILVRKAMQLNLEYLADDKAAAMANSSSDYQLTLLHFAVRTPASALIQHFGQSFIKNRIVMLNKKPSSTLQRWRYAFIIPALALGCALVSATTTPHTQQLSKDSAQHLVVGDSIYNARFPGGKSEFALFCAKNIRYPRVAQENNVVGYVTVTYTIQPDGSVSDVKTVKFPKGGELMGQEVKRVVELAKYSADAKSAPINVVQNAKFMLEGKNGPVPFPEENDKNYDPLIVIVGYGVKN